LLKTHARAYAEGKRRVATTACNAIHGSKLSAVES
jgi:hypothetical protein